MLEYKDSQLRVNLLLNRASQWADVYNYIPYEGRVDLKMKQGCRSVRVRAPEWVETQCPQMVCKVNGSPRSLHWEGRYVNVGAARAGDVVSVTFPISERTVKESIRPKTYTLVVKRNTVVSIDPPGKNGPLYQNCEKYRNDQVQWRQLKRFVPAQEIPWCGKCSHSNRESAARVEAATLAIPSSWGKHSFSCCVAGCER